MSRPPRLARFLVRLFASRARNEAYLGDLEEMYLERASSHGRRRSRLWFWKEALRSLPAYIRENLFWSLAMFKNYLKTAARALNRRPGYALLNIIGLAVGIVSALLIWLWVQDELGFDAFHRNVRTLFRVESVAIQPNGSQSHSTRSPYPLGPALEAEIPECAAVTRVGDPGILLVQAGERSFYEQSLLAVDPAFLEMFTFPLVRGDAAAALAQPMSVVISWEMADKYFPGENPMGKTMTFNRDFPLTVTGVMKNPPSNSTLRPHFLAHVDRMDDLRSTRDYWKNINRWDLAAFTTWVKLRNPQAAPSAAEKISALFKQRTGWKNNSFVLAPLTGLRLSVSRPQIRLFLGLAFFLLLVACINFMNLATARAADRAKEIGLRKVVGAFRRNIVAQFYGETFLTTFLAVVAAAGLFLLLFPLFQRISGKEIGLGAVLGWRFIGGFSAIIILTGLLAGSYPALLLSSLRPSKTLRGPWRAGAGAASLRRILVVFQFALSAFLLIGTGIITRQVHHVRTMGLGYEKSHLVYVSLRIDAAKLYPLLKSELQGDPIVPAVTASFQPPMNNGMQEWGTRWEGKDPEARTYVYYDDVDYGYVETMGLSLAAGRAFSSEHASDAGGAFLVNERMVRQMNLASPSEALGKSMTSWNKTGPIIGVVKDYHFQSARSVIEPQVISLGRDKIRYAVFRLKGGRIQDGLQRITAAWTKVNPGHPFEYRFFDEAFETMYRADEQLGTILKIFSAMGVLIACLGLLGLASFTAARRTREIGIRKVLGASVPGLTMLLGKEFLAWVAVANLLAWPAAYWAAGAWLKSFAFRASFGWWLFPLVAAGTLALALGTVGYKAVRLASAKPVDALRYE
ncbi:MAG: ABC transporter permease [Candidatus Aminicenantes bacterium]|nr:ABC transporter permease [Candidatus Aminicenantes bacterium]